MNITQAGLGMTEAMHEVARELARKHDLISDQGVIICWNCRDADALMPSLHCATCLTKARKRLNIEPTTVNVAQPVKSVDMNEPQHKRWSADELKRAVGE